MRLEIFFNSLPEKAMAIISAQNQEITRQMNSVQRLLLMSKILQKHALEEILQQSHWNGRGLHFTSNRRQQAVFPFNTTEMCTYPCPLSLAVTLGIMQNNSYKIDFLDLSLILTENVSFSFKNYSWCLILQQKRAWRVFQYHHWNDWGLPFSSKSRHEAAIPFKDHFWCLILQKYVVEEIFSSPPEKAVAFIPAKNPDITQRFRSKITPDV